MDKWILFFLLIAVCSCSESNLPKYAFVNRLRVLSLKAAVPEISPGDTVPAVSALVLDPDGGGRVVNYTWVGCFEAATSEISRYTCENASDRVSLGTGASSTGGVVTIPSSILSSLSSTRSYNGINYIVSVTVSAGSESIQSFKRIVISSNPTKNTNPTITSILRNNVALANGDAVGTGTELLANIPSSSYESYTYQNASTQIQSATEDLLITWFYTEGAMDVARTFAHNHTNYWNPPGTKQRSQVTLAVVVHDGRGGADWATVSLQ